MLADNLRLLRNDSKLTQEELAEICDVSRQSVTKWEYGYSIPTIDKLMILSQLYKVSLDELVGNSEIDKHEKIKQYITEFAAKDIPVDENNEIYSFVIRFLLFSERMGLSVEQRMEGLEEIFFVNESEKVR